MKNLPIELPGYGLSDLSNRLKGDLRVQCSSEAIEWYSKNMPDICRSIKYQVEPNPYRLYKLGEEYHYALQFVETLSAENGRVSVLNPGWVEAPYELVVVYGDFGMGAFAYERKEILV